MPTFYDLILNSADGAYVVNARQRIVLWNRQAREVLGHSARETLGRFCYEVMGGKDPFGYCICKQSCRTLLTAERRGRVKSFNMRTRKRDGSEIEINVSIIVIPGKGRRPRAIVHLFREVPAALRATTAPRPHVPLSEREMEVLGLMASGASTRAIADTLFISWATVRNHIRNILQKLGVHSKAEAIAFTYRQNIAPQK